MDEKAAIARIEAVGGGETGELCWDVVSGGIQQAAGHASPGTEETLSQSRKFEGGGLRDGTEGRETGQDPQRSVNREERTEKRLRWLQPFQVREEESTKGMEEADERGRRNAGPVGNSGRQGRQGVKTGRRDRVLHSWRHWREAWARGLTGAALGIGGAKGSKGGNTWEPGTRASGQAGLRAVLLQREMEHLGSSQQGRGTREQGTSKPQNSRCQWRWPSRQESWLPGGAEENYSTNEPSRGAGRRSSAREGLTPGGSQASSSWGCSGRQTVWVWCWWMSGLWPSNGSSGQTNSTAAQTMGREDPLQREETTLNSKFPNHLKEIAFNPKEPVLNQNCFWHGASLVAQLVKNLPAM